MEITISILTIPWEKKLKIWLTGSQDVQVESDSEPDNDDIPDPSDRDANEKDVCKYRPVGENGIKIHLKCMTL